MKAIQYMPGMVITEPGIYQNVPIDRYHHDRDLFDGPAVSKSNLSKILPTMEGSPKAFWGRWIWNKDRVEPPAPTEALIFGRAAHCLMLGDEVFSERFVIRPQKAPDGRAWNGNNNSCKEWLAEQSARGLWVLTADQVEMIRRMSVDAAAYPLIQQHGLLNGSVERTLVAKDPKTGIWLKYRPDNMVLDGIHSDLKSVGKMDEDFLRRQWHDNGYFLQAAIGKMVCDLLGIPFHTFVLVFVLKDEVPDTAHVEADMADIDLGERTIRWALDTIKACMETGDWPGARPFGDGTVPIRMKDWSRDRLINFLDYAEKLETAA